MVEIRLVGFHMQDMPELEQLIADALDAHGLKAAGYIVFDNSYTRRCLDQEPHPHIVVSSENQAQLDTAALQMNATLGVMVRKEPRQEFLVPLPIDDWRNRGR